MTSRFPIRFHFLALFNVAMAGAADGPTLEFASTVDPFVADNCMRCHGEKKQKGDFRFDTLSRDLEDPAVAIHWMDVLDMIESGDMPPEDVDDRPSDDQLAGFSATIRQQLLQVAESHDKIERPEIRRLSHSAMDNTVQDLTGVALPLSTDLPPDPEVAGFDNIAETMTISQEVMSQLQKNAHRIAQFALFDGEDPAFAQSFTGKTLAGGKDVRNIGNYKVTFSNKNGGHSFYPAQFAAPFPGYYDIEILGFAMDNRHAIYPDGVPAKLPLVKEKPFLRKAIPLNKARYAQLRALHPEADGSMPKGSGAAPPPSRVAGEIRVTHKPELHRIRIWLDAGETFFLQYGSGIRAGAPLIKHKGKQIQIGEAIYIRAFAVTGPIKEEWPLPLVKLIQSDSSRHRKISALLTRTFRRPVDPETLSLYQSLFDERLAQTQDETLAFRQVLEAALCSPRFFFNYDDGATNQSWAVACRLSYFLWNSMPDDELFNLAASGDLVDPAIVGQQARRMLSDWRTERFVDDFSGQWLSTRHVGKMVPDPKLYPTYDQNLEDAFKAEPGAFFNEVLQKNLSITAFIDSDFAMLNQRLATHYGIKDVTGPEFRAVKLPRNSPRGGILGQASLLTATSDGTRTSPVIRGIWVLENILGGSISPPPASVKPLEPDVRGALSIREMLEKHRTVESCNDCHKKIDPLGFALENFDPIGSWRDVYVTKKTNNRPASRKPIHTAGKLPDGTKIKDFESLKKALLGKQERFAATLTEKLFVHAMGRIPSIHEHHLIEEIVTQAEANDYRLADLIVSLCQSAPFAKTKPAPVTVASIE